MLFLAILPYLCVYLTSLEGGPSKSLIQRDAVAKYYLFLVLNVFIGITLQGGLFQTLEQIVKYPSTIVSLLGSSIPQASTFFITYISLRWAGCT